MRVLITGAAGAIGRTLRAGLAGRYEMLRLADIRPLGERAAQEEHIVADLTDPAGAAAAVDGMDAVVHLAGIPRENSWDLILPNNIAATYNVFEAARQAGVKRLIFASSNHVIGYYRADQEVGAEVMPRPDSRYGVSKVFGEAVGRLYADKHGISVACLRIGSFRERPEDARQLATWISPRDMTQLARCCLEGPDYHFLVVYGVSANSRRKWRDDNWARIGFRPEDDAERFASQFAIERPSAGDVAAQFHGGKNCADGFSGDIHDID
jgi:uronate dehydrogenase